MVQSKPKHVGANVTYFHVNFNVLKQNYCALVGVIKEKYIPILQSPCSPDLCRLMLSVGSKMVYFVHLSFKDV